MKIALLVGLLATSVPAQAVVTIRFTGTTFTSLTRTVSGGVSTIVDDADGQSVTGRLTIDPTLGAADAGQLPYNYASGGAGFVTGRFTSTGATPAIVTTGTITGVVQGDPDPDFGFASIDYAAEDADVASGGLRTTAYSLLSATPVAFTTVDGIALPDFRALAPGNLFFTVTTRVGTDTDYVETVSQGFAALAAVPEPATWGMMALGFGMVGAAARRSRMVQAAA